MNYIKHLTGFFERVTKDRTLNPTHISLYIALFQSWNCNRFRNPISISRDEIMRISKISSKATYHKCLKNLHSLGYIKYEPSYNPFRGSHVYLYNFSEDLKPDLKKDRNQSSIFEPTTKLVEDKQRTSNDVSTEQVVVPYINNTNISNDKNESKNALAKKIKKSPENLEKKEQIIEFKNALENTSSIPEKEKSSAKKEKDFVNYQAANKVADNSIQSKPAFNEVFNYFMIKEFDINEAQKFYNYYESNGWLIGGKANMIDWEAAIQNWMLKTEIFNPKVTTNKPTITNHLNTTTNKDYSEPL